MMTLAERVKAARKHAQLTQKALAIKVGVEQPVISQLETGKNLASVHLTKIAKVCGVNPLWLSGEDAPMVSKSATEVVENGGVYRIASDMELVKDRRIPGKAIGPMLGASAAFLGGLNVFAESEKDAEFVESVLKDVPLTLRVRLVKESLAKLKPVAFEELARTAVGVRNHAPEILILLDAVLEAAALDAIDSDEISAITTLVRKRRNEKVHGVRSPEE